MIIIYKGYLKSEGKKPIEKVHPDNFVKWNTARRYESYAGVLDDDYVMIDIDTIEESDLLLDIIEDLNLQCSVLETTNGIHVYFKGHDIPANRIEWFSPIGIQVTAKLGSKNTVDPLKIGGEVRPWIIKAAEHEPLPKWLYPVDKHDNYVDKIGTGSRNQELFNYILKLQSLNMDKQEIRETIRIINQYVLDEPLPEDEIQTILRDDSFKKKSFFKGSTFLHDAFSKFLIQEHHIIRIVEVLHIYKDGIYSEDQHDIERVMIQHLPMLTKARRLEVLSYLQLKAPERQLSSERYIAVKNGIIDIETWELTKFRPEVIIKNKVPVDYVPNSYHEVVDKTLNKISVQDESLRRLLDEIFGYTLLRRNEMRKIFILTGGGQNGKSTFLKMLREFIGGTNTSSLDLKELDQRFKTAELFGKLVNIGDDISKEYIRNSAMLKKLATGEAVNVERKGKDPFDFANYSKLIFSANEAPRINDSSDGLTSRLLLIPFKAKFTPQDKDYDPFIHDKVTSQAAMEYLLVLAIQSLKRLLNSKKFTVPDAVKRESDKYEEENNPILTFIKDLDFDIANSETNRVYKTYQLWCVENGLERPLSRINFTKEICKRADVESKQRRNDEGKRRYFYVKPDE